MHAALHLKYENRLTYTLLVEEWPDRFTPKTDKHFYARNRIHSQGVQKRAAQTIASRLEPATMTCAAIVASSALVTAFLHPPSRLWFLHSFGQQYRLF